MELYKTFLAELSKCFSEDSVEKKDAELISPEKLSELLTKLKDVCENLDMDGMDSVKEELEQYSWPKDKKDFLGDLCEAISMYDSITCEELIAKL